MRMSKIIEKIPSPDRWPQIAAVVAVVGMCVGLLGVFLRSKSVIYFGIYLILPLLLMGVFLTIVVIPIAILMNRRQEPPPASEDEMNVRIE